VPDVDNSEDKLEKANDISIFFGYNCVLLKFGDYHTKILQFHDQRYKEDIGPLCATFLLYISRREFQCDEQLDKMLNKPKKIKAVISILQDSFNLLHMMQWWQDLEW